MERRAGLIASLSFVVVALIVTAVIFHGERYLPGALIAVGFWTVVSQLRQ